MNDQLPVLPSLLLMSRQDRIDMWARQAFLAYRDGRLDLVDICLKELSAAGYGGDRIDWGAEP